MIRQQKWLLGIALCLCMLAGTAMVTAKAAAGDADPPTITFGDFSDGRYTIAVSGKNLTDVNYNAGADSSDDTFRFAIDQKQNKLTITTEPNKLSELCYVPVNATLNVPAYTTYNVELTFTINATQKVSNSRATAHACFELLEFGTESGASPHMQFKPAAKDNTAGFGAINTNGTSLAKGYVGSGGTSRPIGNGNYEVTVPCAFQNSTESAQDVTYYFALWAETQYASSYDNSLNIELSVASTNPLYPLYVPFADRTYAYGTPGTPGISGELDQGYRGYLYDYRFYICDKDGGNKVLVGTTTTDFDTPVLRKLYTTPADLPVGKYYYYVEVTTRTPSGDTPTSVRAKVTKLNITKATPNIYDWPAIPTLDLSKGETLEDCVLSGGSGENPYSKASVSGTFKWDNPNTVPTKTGTQRFPATFYPDDTLNYNTTAVSMTVNIICSQHKYDEGTITKAATCTTTGSLRKSCIYCGQSSSSTIPALGHDFTGGTWLYDETQHWKKCSRCTIEDATNKVNHTFGSWSSGKRSCTACGYEETSIISVTITWGEMAFTCTDGTWDPKTHNYIGGGWKPNSTDGNKVTAKNEGTETVKVTFSYTSTDSIVRGVLSGTTAATLPADGSASAWLHLWGTPDKELNNEKIGTVTVKLGGN